LLHLFNVALKVVLCDLDVLTPGKVCVWFRTQSVMKWTGYTFITVWTLCGTGAHPIMQIILSIMISFEFQIAEPKTSL